MPLLSEDDRARMLRASRVCATCKVAVRTQYCRSCDEFFSVGHESHCGEQDHVVHAGHRIDTGTEMIPPVVTRIGDDEESLAKAAYEAYAQAYAGGDGKPPPGFRVPIDREVFQERWDGARKLVAALRAVERAARVSRDLQKSGMGEGDNHVMALALADKVLDDALSAVDGDGGMPMTCEQHLVLHQALDQLLAVYLTATGRRPSQTTVLELLEWSHQQTIEPGEPKR